MGARHYNPQTGRFISPDPIGMPININLYDYAGGDPVNFIDPDGRYASYAYQTTKTTLISTWHNPRFQGSLQAAGGMTETCIGGLMTLKSGGLLAGTGWAAMSHGLDQFFTGMRQVFSGQEQTTATHTALMGMGVSENAAAMTDLGMGLLFPMSSVALRSTNVVRTFQSVPSTIAKPTSEVYRFVIPNRPATSSVSAKLLRNRYIAEEISQGHAFKKHVIKQKEYPGFTRLQFKQHIEKILNRPDEIKYLKDNRMAFWDYKSETVVIRDPGRKDGGTAFRPRFRKEYFDNRLN
jgi:hypothetical protein